MFFKLTEKRVKKHEDEWLDRKALILREQKINQEKKNFKSENKNKSFSKKIIWFLFLNCTIIELFTMWATIQSFSIASKIGSSPDFTPLTTLIGSVVGEVIGFAVYAAKAAKENTEGGIVYRQSLEENRKDDYNE